MRRNNDDDGDGIERLTERCSSINIILVVSCVIYVQTISKYRLHDASLHSPPHTQSICDDVTVSFHAAFYRSGTRYLESSNLHRERTTCDLTIVPSYLVLASVRRSPSGKHIGYSIIPYHSASSSFHRIAYTIEQHSVRTHQSTSAKIRL